MRIVLASLLISLFAAPTPPLATSYLDLTIKYTKGTLSIVSASRVRYPSPTVTRRFTGRFEARSTARGKPLDTFRFDLPLLADADAGNEPALADKLKANLVTTGRVRVPLPDGADALTIVDSHGGAPLPVALPRESATSPPDAGADGPPPP